MPGPRGPRPRSPQPGRAPSPRNGGSPRSRPARFRRASARVTTMRSARVSADRGSRSVPRGKSPPGPHGARASRHTISTSFSSRRCWNPSSSSTTSGRRFATAHWPARRRSAPTTTATPGRRRARRSGSSPARSAGSLGAPPSDTSSTGAPGRRPYPRLTMTTRRPSSVSQRATISTAGVLPVPPTVRFPRETTAHGSRPRASQPRRYASSRTARPPRYAHAAGVRTKRSGPARPSRQARTSRPRRKAPGSLVTGCLSAAAAGCSRPDRAPASASTRSSAATVRTHAPWCARTAVQAARPRACRAGASPRSRPSAAASSVPSPTWIAASARSSRAAASRKFVMCGPKTTALRVKRRLHDVVPADRDEAAADEDDVGDGIERRQLAHRVEKDHGGAVPRAHAAPPDDGEPPRPDQAFDLVQPLGVARRQHEPEPVGRRPRRQESVEDRGLLAAMRAARHDDRRLRRDEAGGATAARSPASPDGASIFRLPVTSTRSGGAPRLMIRRASSSDCMQKSATSASTRRNRPRTRR